MDFLLTLWRSTGIAALVEGDVLGPLVMIAVSLGLIYLAIVRRFEPLLLFPIGFGGLVSNLPLSGILERTILGVGPQGLVVVQSVGGFLGQVYAFGIESGLFPILIFMGVGAMTDFSPLIANPLTALLGAAAQLGIFAALWVALLLGQAGWLDFGLKEAASIGIIGGADGPTAIYLTTRMAPQLLGAVAVAAYSYMALVPLIQPPIMRLLTSRHERAIRMEQQRPVSRRERLLFPIVVTLLAGLLLPDSVPLVGALMMGNLARESGVVQRLVDAMQGPLMNTVTLLLGLAVGTKLEASLFLRPETLAILALGALAFSLSTAGGVLMAKALNLFLRHKINPLIGAAGVSAVPMAARVVNRVGLEADSQNYLLMHAMGPNVAGVIGSAAAAGYLLAVVPLLGG